MLRMDQVQVVRHKHYTEGHSIRRISREMGVDRKTVRKYLKESEPRRVEREARRRPVLDEVGPRIDGLLEEWRPRSTRKHRITSPRVHRQLVEEGYTVAERTVREYLAEKRRQEAEVYIPLVHRPGEEAQVDFFAVTVETDGDRREAWKFVMRLMYSGRDFVHVYERCDTVSFLDGHVRAFGYYGGVPRRAIYDNLSAAVKRVIRGSGRELTNRFQALCSHYVVEPCFARVGEGHDKGGVEGRGRGIRWQHMTPIVRGRDLDDISAKVLADVERCYPTKRRRDGARGAELFEEERKELLSLPTTPFEARDPRPVAISRSATVMVQGVRYSLPSRWSRLDAMAYVGPTDIRFICRGEVVVLRRKERGEDEIRYRHYLRELSRKPNAVRQVVPELIMELGEPYDRLWRLLDATHGARKGARILAGILGAMDDHGEECVTAALEEAMREGRCDLVALHRYLPPSPVLREIAVPVSLRAFEVEVGRAADYDALLIGGVR